ncbi:MAG: P-II family nitrogen regulator [Candidatus Acidiferrales bacterium]
MEFAKVTAIICNAVIKDVEAALEKAGVSGFTVAKVQGVGQWEKKFSLFNGPSTHFKIEVFTEATRAELIAGVIMDAAHTGSVGDGLVAILPVHKVFRIRNKALAEPGEV